MKIVVVKSDEGVEVSDGYHTFTELYSHRVKLWIVLCAQLAAGPGAPVWRSRYHSDGSSISGWFLLGVGKLFGEQMTYHLPDVFWPDCSRFAETLDFAPPFDGHTSGDVLTRLGRWI